VTNGIGDDSAFGAVTPPLYLPSNFTFEGFQRPRQYDYTRSGNPTRDLLADTIAQLEGGAGAVVVSTGMAAVDLSIASLEPGDLIVAPHDCYAGTWRLLDARRAKRQFDVAFIDQSDQAMVEMALARSPKLVLIETGGSRSLPPVAPDRCGNWPSATASPVAMSGASSTSPF
jgi:cystathionine gamma-synthase